MKSLFFILFVFLTLKFASPTNLCSTAGLCCKHRDSECVAQKVFPNHTVDTSQLPCYCDHACLRLDDCCPDYKHFCSGNILHRVSWRVVFASLGTSAQMRRKKCPLPLFDAQLHPFLAQHLIGTISKKMNTKKAFSAVS